MMNSEELKNVGNVFSFETLASRHNFERGPKIDDQDNVDETKVN